MISRVAGTITDWGRQRGYFASAEDGDAFEAELTHILLHQMAAFNSPVWFNVGFEESPQCRAWLRATKMVVPVVDHPDIRDFIWCKAKEEDKAAALRDAGFDMSIDGDGFTSIQYQNAKNSFRLTDDFMHAVENDEDWHLIARTTGEPVGEPIPRART